MTLLTIRIEGGLLSPDFLDTIHDQPGQKPADFGLDARRSLVDEVTAVWSDVRTYWEAFERRRARARDGESLTSITREAWIIPLLEALGYRLTFQRRAAEADGRTYPISHRANASVGAGLVPALGDHRGSPLPTDDASGPPVHIVAFDQKLGERPPAGRGTMAPHALVQDYLNRSDDSWGIVTNGATLRLLRDSVYFSRPSYIEFDLQGMLEGERLDEFILFYRLAHRTRLAAAGEDGSRCLLEGYHQAAVEQGGRIRDGLRKAVEGAILTLANGFLSHGRNGDLRRAVVGDDGSAPSLTATAFYQELLYLIYRLLFLMVAEERNLLVLADPAGRGEVTSPLRTPPLQGRGDHYLDHYSITHLRRLAEAPLSGPQRFDDLYLGLRSLFQVLRDEDLAPMLGIPALNGELFDMGRTRHLEAAHLNNRDLLSAIGQLSYFTPEREQVRRRVNYAALDVEELGSVYESLLDEHPIFEGAGTLSPIPLPSPHSPVPNPRSPLPSPQSPLPTFSFVRGTERKTTGSYYTARELVKETLDSALDPVIAEQLNAPPASTAASPRRPGPAAVEAEEKADSQIGALLSLRICDPACGSGHFLLAAARRTGRVLAQVDTGDDEPSPEAVRHWTREAIIHCIYGVDKNPLAVDLCKVALWIEGHAPGKPLTFLDAHIKCGDSLVGVFDLKALDDGIPDAAFTPVTGDDKPATRELKRRNKQERSSGQLAMTFHAEQAALGEAARQWQAQLDSPEDTPAQVRRKQAAYHKLQQQEDAQRTACDLWTAAFFTPLTAENDAAGIIPTTATLQDYRRQPIAADPRLVAHARALAVRNQFFHWPVEFPHVFAAGGFTVMLGNPPWDMLQLDPQDFFAVRAPEIANAPNTAARDRMIASLGSGNTGLHEEYLIEKHRIEAYQKYVHQGGRFPLTSFGRINLMSLFAELARHTLSPDGCAGLILPIGIATDSFNQYFFADLVNSQSLVRLLGFENEAFIFPGVHHAFKFCSLTISGTGRRYEQADFAFFCRQFRDVDDKERHFFLLKSDFALLNPNTQTCPIFRTGADADLTKSIYQRVPVLQNDATAEDPWTFKGMLMFMMNTDSGLFETKRLDGYVPLYEAKMMHQFDHRYATYEGASQANLNAGILPQLPAQRKADPSAAVLPHYWISASTVEARLQKWHHGWLLGFRDITSAVVERTAICSLVPRVGVGNKIPLLLFPNATSCQIAGFLANANALPFDYVVRQKIAGTSLNFFIVRQLPVLPPNAYTDADLLFVTPRVLELVYTAWDMAPFAADLWADADEALRARLEEQHQACLAATGGHPWEPPDWAGGDDCPAPFAPAKWDEERRAVLRAELDAYYARLYGLTRKQLRYILDPADLTPAELRDILDPWEEVADPLDPAGYAARVAASDFPGETFRVLKEKEQRGLGEYRTRRLVLEAWDRLEAELGPVVVRNYREEMAAGAGARDWGPGTGDQEPGVGDGGPGVGDREQGAGKRGRRVAEAGPAYRATMQAVTPEPPAFGVIRAPAPTATPAEQAAPDLFAPEPSAEQPTAAPTQVGARPQAPQLRPRSPDAAPGAAPDAVPAAPSEDTQPKAVQPPLIPSPPQGSYQQRLSQVMALRGKDTPDAIGGLVAALGDEDGNIRWLAASVLQSIGGATVIATLRAFIAQAPSPAARDEAEKVLGKLEETSQ